VHEALVISFLAQQRAPLLAHSAPSPDREGQPYAEHVSAVLQGARDRAEAMLRYAVNTPKGLMETIEAAGTFHDLGKMDADIQEALSRGRKASLAWDHIDAGVAYLAAQKNWMAAWLVRAHHAPGLPQKASHFDIDGLGRRLRGRRNDEDQNERHEAQTAHTDANLPNYLWAHTAEGLPVGVPETKISHGLSMRLALSCLVDADHADTARFDSGHVPPFAPEPRWNERLQCLDAYVASLRKSENADRDRNRTKFYQACRAAEVAGTMVSCAGPVGLGKTTAVTAHLLRRAEKDTLRRIFVVAPYTNVITQTVDVLRKALTLPGEEPSDVVAEHHHRADFDSIDSRELAILWRAPVVVTTAVQFFETLAACNPGPLRKLHMVPGSAVVLDEAHAALPVHLWPQNWQWLCELAEKWSCRFVFSSGSLAKFWESQEIVGEPIRLPELLPPDLARTVLQSERRRVSYRSHKRMATVDDLRIKISDARGPRLVILNTVQSAAVVARAMREKGDDVHHLSTALCPRDRDKILARVHDRLRSETKDWSLIATSCVEAGVDLSFRTALRERFSTASLIQVGGRVNRHGEFDAEGGAEVYDFTIDQGEHITSHPAAKVPAQVLNRFLRSGALVHDAMEPARLVTDAMIEELKDRGGLNNDLLSKAERERDYPEVAKRGRVIAQDTCLVVIDRGLCERIEGYEKVSFQELQRGSVQIWATKVGKLGIDELRGRRGIYFWPHAYDPDCLGYMAGALQLGDFWAVGGAII
jgi:CRISPR-associated endonuclease/helicase Cas3